MIQSARQSYSLGAQVPITISAEHSLRVGAPVGAREPTKHSARRDTGHCQAVIRITPHTRHRAAHVQAKTHEICCPPIAWDNPTCPRAQRHSVLHQHNSANPASNLQSHQPTTKIIRQKNRSFSLSALESYRPAISNPPNNFSPV